MSNEDNNIITKTQQQLQLDLLSLHNNIKYAKFKKLYDNAKSPIEKQSAKLLMEMVINEKN